MDKLLFVALIFAATCASALGQDRMPKRTIITAADLNTRFQVQGSLGVPLGTVVTIVGEVEDGRKVDGSPRFLRVTSVSGRPLFQPVMLPYQLSSVNGNPLANGTKYKLRAYEHGGFSGTPQDDMTNGPPRQELGYGFYSHLVVLSPSVARPAEPAAENSHPK